MIEDTFEGKTNYCTHVNNNTSGICNKCLGNPMTHNEHQDGIVNIHNSHLYGQKEGTPEYDFLKEHQPEEWEKDWIEQIQNSIRMESSDSTRIILDVPKDFGLDFIRKTRQEAV